MAVETLHPDPQEEGQVIRTIVPGGHEERKYLLYPNPLSARIAQWFDSKSFIPDVVTKMVDDGKPVGRERLDGFPIDEQDVVSITCESETLLHDTIVAWRNRSYNHNEETQDAA